MTGREGPPGADYHTLPELKPLAMQLMAGYWHRDHAGDRDHGHLDCHLDSLLK